MIDDVLGAVLRGDPVAASAFVACDQRRLVEEAERHGILPLLADALVRRRDLPATLCAHLKEEAARHVAADIVREAELCRLLDALDQAAVPAVLMKGAELAYTHYVRPDLRPRVDTDLLIPATARLAVDKVLTGLRYTLPSHVSGNLVMSQAPYVKHREGARVHAVDVHWRIANPQVFADLLSYDELAHAAVPIKRLHRSARGLSDVHALLVACVHRIAHHFDSDRLIWLYDIHLVGSRLDQAGWARFADLAVERRVAAVCRQSLGRTAQVFNTRVPTEVTTRLEEGTREATEPTAAYLQRHRRIGIVLGDLHSLPTWTDRWQLLCEHLLPPARYMREVYAPTSGAPLPLLYARRVLSGARKWLARPSGQR